MPPQGTMPDPETTRLAGERLVEWGVVGAVLFVVLSFAIALVWWTLRTTSKERKEKDTELARVNDRRVEAATKMVEVCTRLTEQSGRILDMLNHLASLLEADRPPHTAGHGGADEPAQPAG